MNAEFFEAVEDIEKEKGIPRAYMYDKIKQAMLAAFRRAHGREPWRVFTIKRAPPRP